MTGTAEGRGVRRQGVALPESLRLPATIPALEAFGLRARAEQMAPGVLAVEIEGRFSQVVPTPRLGEERCAVWPFAALRESPGGREVLFAAPDQPLVALIRDVDAADAAVEAEGPLAVSIVPLGDARSAIVVHDPAFESPDVESLIAAATARGRRRAANRPSLVVDESGEDAFAIAEHDLRRELRRVGPDAIATSGSRTQAVSAVLALYALNDRNAADEMLRGLAAAAIEGADCALVVGACAAWTGMAPQASEVRAAALQWMRAAPVASDAWSAAALGLAPVAAEAMGATEVMAQLRAGKLPGVSDALRELAAEASGIPAGRVLQLMHDQLGVAPDAMRGRIGIRPMRVAGRIDVERLVVSDAMLSFHAETRVDRATFEVEQTSGGSPVTVLLEPRIPARRLMSALVDETSAELDAVPEDSDLRVKVQLVADRPRRLELRYER